MNNDLELAKENLKEAIKLEPNNTSIRECYQELVDLKNKKEKEWFQKMSGFLDSDKLKRIEQRDANEEKLRHKVYRQTFRRRDENKPPQND